MKNVSDGAFSATNRIIYHIINSRAGLKYGPNEYDYVDIKRVKRLSDLIGIAEISTTRYSIFLGYNLNEEITSRSLKIDNQQIVHFIDKRLLSLPKSYLL